MGKVRITAEIGEGLYQGTVQYQVTAIQAEILRLEALNADYWRLMNDALDVMIALRKEKWAAKETLDALIQQWIDVLQEKTQPAAPIVPEEAEDENNPVTSLPYTEEERAEALEKEVLAKLNAERVARGLAPFSGLNGTLVHSVRNRLKDQAGPPVELTPDFSSTAYLQMLQRLQSIDNEGQRVHDRLLNALPGTVLVRADEAMAAGQTSSQAVVDAWKRDPDTWEGLMHPNATELGIGYQYAPQFPATHLWNAVSAMLMEPPAQNAAFFADPAGVALLDAITEALGSEAAAAVKGEGEGGGGGSGSSGQWGEPWKPNTEYGIGMSVMGTRPNGGMEVFVKNTSSYGLSGDTQPHWPAPGEVVGDRDITWTVLAVIPKEPAVSVYQFYGMYT